eukprot:1611493-Amphidinium_carterae.1
MERALRGLIYAYMRPLAAMLFPELVGLEDADEHYAFTVRYETDGDTELAKHGDASVVTVNLCMGNAGLEPKARNLHKTIPVLQKYHLFIETHSLNLPIVALCSSQA